MKTYPVSVCPDSLDFYSNKKHTHRQLITIYNPYDFSLTYEVLSTSPKKFNIIDHEGDIPAHCCKDIVVRYVQPSTVSCKTTEKFRITIYRKDTVKELSEKIMTVNVIEEEPLNEDKECKVSNAQSDEQSPINDVQLKREMLPFGRIPLLLMIFCTTLLLLPTRPVPASLSELPDYLHVPSTVKLVFSFILGAIIMFLIQTAK